MTMNDDFPVMTWRQAGMILLLTLAVSLAIGVLHYAVNAQGSLFLHLAFSCIIGFSICLTCLTFARFAKSGRQVAFFLVFAVPIGVFIGRTLGQTVLGFPARSLPRALAEAFLRLPENTATMMFSGLVVGAVITFFIYVKGRHDYMVRRLELESLRAAANEGAMNKAVLQRLQAQIEPHFLFNTLATLDGLIAQRPQEARRLLEKLTDYLRATLERTRQEEGTLADELHVIRGYLCIMETRLGTHLRWQIDVPGRLESTPFPPMLLQPLVENAISHGIEPSENGGSVNIQISGNGKNLILQVADTGVGLQSTNSAKGHGVGLANVRERLQLLYGEAGRLELFANQPDGVIARISIPCQPH
ncbi:MAG: histidine kinase [Burkholderiales bacterium]|nr:histidine kinase [Burkholderiales bacterium]